MKIDIILCRKRCTLSNPFSSVINYPLEQFIKNFLRAFCVSRFFKNQEIRGGIAPITHWINGIFYRELVWKRLSQASVPNTQSVAHHSAHSIQIGRNARWSRKIACAFTCSRHQNQEPMSASRTGKTTQSTLLHAHECPLWRSVTSYLEGVLREQASPVHKSVRPSSVVSRIL